MATAHENLSKKARLAVSENKVGRLFKNDTGSIKGQHRYQVYGLGPGTSDNVGYSRTGKFLAVEIKIPPDDLSEQQIIFKNQCIENGCHHFTIYCEADIAKMILKLKQTARTIVNGFGEKVGTVYHD